MRNLGLSLRNCQRSAASVHNRGAGASPSQVGRHLITRGAAGSIIYVSSTHGLVGAVERSTYGITKGALIQMTRMLAIEWADHGIRVNAVAPGRLDTPSPSRARTGSDKSYMDAMLKRIP